MVLGVTAWTLIVVAAILVGLAKTALPGSGILPVALLAGVLPAKASTGIVLLMLIVGDVAAITVYRRDADFGALKRLLPAVLVGVAAGGGYLSFASDLATKRTIGGILLAMVTWTVVRRRLSRRPNPHHGDESSIHPVRRWFYGSLAGFTTMVANAGGPVTSIYMLSAGFDVVRFLGTTAWFYFAVNLIKVPVAIAVGSVGWQTLTTAGLMAPVILLSALVGVRLARIMPQRVFDPLVLGFSALAAAWLLV